MVAKVPPPKGDPDAPLKALIIDSWFDNYVGVVMLVRVVDGVMRPKDKLFFMATEAPHLSRSACFPLKSVAAQRTAGAGESVSSFPASRN